MGTASPGTAPPEPSGATVGLNPGSQTPHPTRTGRVWGAPAARGERGDRAGPGDTAKPGACPGGPGRGRGVAVRWGKGQWGRGRGRGVAGAAARCCGGRGGAVAGSAGTGALGPVVSAATGALGSPEFRRDRYAGRGGRTTHRCARICRPDRDRCAGTRRFGGDGCGGTSPPGAARGGGSGTSLRQRSRPEPELDRLRGSAGPR